MKKFMGIMGALIFNAYASFYEYSPDTLKEYAMRAVIKKNEHASLSYLNRFNIPSPLKESLIDRIVYLSRLRKDHLYEQASILHTLLMQNTLTAQEEQALKYIVCSYPKVVLNSIFKLRPALILAHDKRGIDDIVLRLFYSPYTDIFAGYAGFSIFARAVQLDDHEMVHRILQDERFLAKYSVEEVQKARNIASSSNYNRLYLTLDHFLLMRDGR